MKDIENFADRQRDVEAVQKLAKPRTKPYRDHAGGVVPDLAGDLHENIFTKSRAVKLSFDSHQSHTSQQLGPQLTDPESISLDAFRQERPESDLEARCGSSNSNHSESSLESSLSSMDLRNVLPRPTTQDEIREIGHLLPKPLRHFEASELQPSTDHEAQVVTESIDRTLDTTRAADAFQAHLTHTDSMPELLIQRKMIMPPADTHWTMKRKQKKRRIKDIVVDPIRQALDGHVSDSEFS